MRVLFFGTYDVRSHPRVAVLRDGLIANGADVVECNRPLGIDTATRVSMLRRPWRLPLLAARITRCWWGLARTARHLRRDGELDAVVVGYMGHFDVLLARRLFRRTTVVLDHLIGASDTAVDRGVGGGVRQRLLRALDGAALRSADVVVVDTQEHLDVLPDAHRTKGIVVPVGAPDRWFADAPRTTAVDGPIRVVFFGLFTPLQGAPVIGRALALLADDDDVECTMIGTGQEFDDTRTAAAPNRHVRWIDWVAADELPAEVAAHDVCLGIFGTGPKALRVVPNKVFQGAAAGCAMVTSDTAPQRRMLGEAAIYVPPGDHEALAEVLRRLAAHRTDCDAARQRARVLAGRAFTPATCTEPLLTLLQER